MAIKFSQLPATSTLANNDLFAVTSTAENTSVSISFANLKNIMVDASTFTDNVNDVVSALNAYTTAGTTPALNAGTLGGFDSAHHLNWDNLTGVPTVLSNMKNVPLDLHDFDNSNEGGGFIKLVSDGVTTSLRFDLVDQGVTQSQTQVTTDYLTEGSQNLYYTDDRVEQYFDTNFATFFNNYNTTFDQGEVNDSYHDTVGFAPDGTLDASNLGRVIRIRNEGQIPGMTADYAKRDQAGRFASYQPGKVLRIYGADSPQREDLQNQLISSIETVGFTFVLDGQAGITPAFASADVDISTNTITFREDGATVAHGFTEGDEVIYNHGLGTSIGGLTSGATYYVIEENASVIQLATSYANATAGTPVAVSLTTQGTGTTHTITPTAITNPYQRFTYRICEFDMNTGQIAPAGTPVAINVSVPATVTNAAEVEAYLQQDQDAILKAFSVENFVKLSFQHTLNESINSGVSQNRGLAIYRSIAQINTVDPTLQGVSKLVAVLGPKDLTNDSWIDYYTDDILDYSLKEQEDNSYIPENTVHFKPYSEGANSERGWVDATIDTVQYEDEVNEALSTFIDITLKSSVKMNSGEVNGVWISHNDTNAIQTGILNNAGRGQKAVRLNPKNYVVSGLTVPPSFSVEGFAYNTKLTKLPWSGWNGSTTASSSKIITAQSETIGTRIVTNSSFVGFDIDGNAVNSIAFDDRTLVNKNYAIDCGQNSTGVLLDKVRMTNIIGGGIYAADSTNLKVVSSEVLNSGVTDRHVFSPLIADGGENTSISSNRFENFSDSLDASVTNKGVIEGNIISNCGSGLLMFGSRFMITSPNVLTGPAGEFLPQPDSYNSEFDSINIDLTSASVTLPVADFNSGPFKYQENGEVYDLTNSLPQYKIFAIKKPTGGEESIWIENLTPPESDYISATDAQTIVNVFDAGNGASIIPANDTIPLPDHDLVTGDPVVYEEKGGTYSSLTDGTTYFVHVVGTGNNLISLYDTQANALVGGDTSAGRVNLAAAGAPNTGANHTLTRSVYVEMRPGTEGDNPPSEGGFQWTIPSESVRRMKLDGKQYTVDYMKNANNTIYHTSGDPDANIPAGTPSSTAGDPDHIGLGWSATVTQFVMNGIIQSNPADPGIWSAQYTDNGKQYANYTIKVSDYKYLAIGRKVRPTAAGVTAHNNFSAGDNTVVPPPADFGVIDSISGSEELKEIVIKWENANPVVASDPTAAVGSSGTLEAENSFVIATGRIK
jgi:hypothetical protein